MTGTRVPAPPPRVARNAPGSCQGRPRLSPGSAANRASARLRGTSLGLDLADHADACSRAYRRATCGARGGHSAESVFRAAALGPRKAASVATWVALGLSLADATRHVMDQPGYATARGQLAAEVWGLVSPRP